MRNLKKRATNVQASQVSPGKVSVVFNVGGEYKGYGDNTRILNVEAAKTATLLCPLTYRGIKLALQQSGFYCEAKHIILPDRDRKKRRRERIKQKKSKVEDKPSEEKPDAA